MLLLSVPIEAGHCSSLRRVPGDATVRPGFLPADANCDGTSGQLDILALIDDLNGAPDPAPASWKCDIDRSGLRAPADILALIDLLNGASPQDAWLGATLPACP